MESPEVGLGREGVGYRVRIGEGEWVGREGGWIERRVGWEWGREGVKSIQMVIQM